MRAQAALTAIREDLERRRACIDADGDLVSLTVTVKFVRGTAQVRGLVYQDERLAGPRTGDPASVQASERASVRRL